MLYDEFISMKEFALIYDSTQKRVGLMLRELGLRNEYGYPTRKAISEGFVSERFYDSAEKRSLVIWNREKSVHFSTQPVGNESYPRSVFPRCERRMQRGFNRSV